MYNLYLVEFYARTLAEPLKKLLNFNDCVKKIGSERNYLIKDKSPPNPLVFTFASTFKFKVPRILN